MEEERILDCELLSFRVHCEFGEERLKRKDLEELLLLKERNTGGRRGLLSLVEVSEIQQEGLEDNLI